MYLPGTCACHQMTLGLVITGDQRIYRPRVRPEDVEGKKQWFGFKPQKQQSN